MQKKALKNKELIFWCIIAGLVRILLALCYYGHPTDMNCFNAWADMMYQSGPSGFYSSDVFTDYPPFYMYILWLIGFIKSILPENTAVVGLLLKLPAITADIVIGILVYKIAPKKNSATAFLWLFAPAVILNSSLWGQVDSVFSLAVLASVILLMYKKYLFAYFLFAVAILIKPQSLFYTPVFLLALAEDAFLPKFDKKKLLFHLAAGLGAIVFALILSLPFGLKNVFSQYVGTLASYNYCSVNAYNFWSAIGLNWEDLELSHTIFSAAAIIGAVAFSVIFWIKMKGEHKIFIICAFICMFVFTFATKTHERYAFPVMMFLIFAYALSKDKRILKCAWFSILLQLVNSAWILFYYDNNSDADKIVSIIFGILCVLFTLYFTFICLDMCGFKIKKSEATLQYVITKADIIAMLFITLIYSVIAFSNLGDRKAPTSGVYLQNEAKSFQLAENGGISGFRIYLGSKNLDDNNTLSIVLAKGDNIIYDTEFLQGSVFCWEEYQVFLESVDSITVATTGEVNILELALLDIGGNIIKGEGALFDEQSLVPERSTYLNGTYFDEIYHARTAYEFIEGEDIYEWTHPPLGKILISIGIRLFGMNPFGWRFVGTLFGVLMLPAIYILAKKLFADSFLAGFATILMTFDFMHLVQTRIATIDVYVVFFIMLQYLFMLLWLRCEDFKKGLLWLALSGLSFGLSAASKWTGIYAGAGLAVIFFLKLISDKDKKTAVKYILFATVFFVVVPLIIYLLSYIPFVKAEGGGFMTIWQNQLNMFGYHSKIEATHPYSSRWYEWAVMARPIWYYAGNSGEGISAFGNPLVWWIGIPALFYTAYCAIKKDKTARFLLIGYLAQLLPWIAVTRVIFIYHYFPCVPFSILMTAFAFNKLSSKKVMTVYAVLVIFLFILFFPVLTGKYVSPDFVESFLRWSDKWELVRG